METLSLEKRVKSIPRRVLCKVTSSKAVIQVEVVNKLLSLLPLLLLILEKYHQIQFF